MKALYANEGRDTDLEHFEARAVDNSEWDGNAAMTAAKTASDYRAICAGRKAGDPSERSSWALPHHKRPGGPPNAAGVRAALARFSQTEGLTNREAARAHLERHMSEVNPERAIPEGVPEVVVRAVPTIQLDEGPSDGRLGTINGVMVPWDEWTEIDSQSEGHFYEQVARGSFLAAIESDRDRYKLLLDHGMHPQQGRNPLGPLEWIREDTDAARYSGVLLDTEFNRSILPGLKAGLYGSSFRGRLHHKIDRFPERSDHNPDGLPEQVVEKVRPLLDVGPTPFPAYMGTVTTARSLTDEFLMAKFAEGEGLQKFAAWAAEQANQKIQMPVIPPPEAERTTAEPSEAKPTDEKKGDSDMAVDIDRYTSRETLAERRDEVQKRITYLRDEFQGRALPTEVRQEWDELLEEHPALVERIKDLDDREATVRALVEDKPQDTATSAAPVIEREERKFKPDNIYDLTAYRAASYSPEDYAQRVIDGAMRAIEVAEFPGSALTKEDAQTAAEKRLKEVPRGAKAVVAEHYLRTGSEVYKRAIGKFAMYQNAAVLSPQEASALYDYQERALSLTGASGGFAVPFELDPTILYTSTGTVNFVRQISRVVDIAVDEWRGISSAGITAAFAAEAVETTDNAPTLAQPTVSTEKAQAFIPFSIEVGMDWEGLQREMARGLQDAKDELEAAKFISGTGTNEPFGVLTGTTNTVAAAAGQTFTIANLYALQNALPPRYQNNATFMGNLAVANRIRQFDTAGGANLWVQLGGAVPPQLLGWDYRIASDMADVATSVKFLVVGDFQRFLIADRIGLTIDLIPHLFGTNHRPTGQRGIYAFWRVGSKVLDANAFRALLGTA